MRHPYEEFHNRNRLNPNDALIHALKWWKRSEFDYEPEKRTIYEWAPFLRERLSRSNIRSIDADSLVGVVARVHAMRDHATKQEKTPGGESATAEEKVRQFASFLWNARSGAGKNITEVLEFVLWGNEAVEKRIWTAVRDESWRIAHVGANSLGEIVGWARPDEFPPRNMRTCKGLRALGFDVSVG